MNIEVVTDYQRWGKRQIVTPITCRRHPSLAMLPFRDIEGIFLVCPKSDHKYYIGLAEYTALERKVQMAEMLFAMKNVKTSSETPAE
jgi:hypothetical protein